jgi:hypothetical protein
MNSKLEAIASILEKKASHEGLSIPVSMPALTRAILINYDHTGNPHNQPTIKTSSTINLRVFGTDKEMYVEHDGEQFHINYDELRRYNNGLFSISGPKKSFITNVRAIDRPLVIRFFGSRALAEKYLDYHEKEFGPEFRVYFLNDIMNGSDQTRILQLGANMAGKNNRSALSMNQQSNYDESTHELKSIQREVVIGQIDDLLLRCEMEDHVGRKDTHQEIRKLLYSIK